ncbi:uncharacterized protein LOC121640493 isoform X2 [Melanotaenia boesemani]|uniref:uncharacterized protein LOC121640493 isoform X2 n=1 Tax=Melanotaenia boesemani TaxID=1250792 RepID=UPI001C04C31A|nr:uncharacterized protein LOC121640493 isoform X2 [Melanotaenia boesemani]
MALSTNVNSPRSNITSYVGQTTTLPCWTPTYSSLSAVEWTRRDQPQYVLFKRDGHVDIQNQLSSFKNRVGLKNEDMEDGDLSLVLEDTEPDDSGIYECRYKERTTRPRRGVLAGHPLSIIDLKVEREQHILAHPGEDIILPCRASRDASVGAVEWVRADLESDGYVLLMRDGIPDTTYQHFSYRDRVELKDDSLKDGNLSLILKNVRSSDMGKFVCRLKESGERGKRSTIQSEPVSIIHLKVADPVQYITVRAGDSVTLPCRAPAETNVRVDQT